ncbi:hypothetical protein GETHOR_10270 [Geothrix oryzae]|uniref:Cation efflux family protein n=1 Tax=Geothrix oryzae TaxID=2927975 RepID=A0ABN6UW25_9BACT|nr:hypothetical protein [Geothrix oryzae]BDU68926.1 hypothetical protein GETHOR_10270 [Geothrix oryzae]
MKADASPAVRLTLLSAGADLILGGAALWLGLSEGAIALWGVGGASLLQIPPALSLRGRILDGLGNRGLDRERLVLRTLSHLLRLLALGLALAAVLALREGPGMRVGFSTLGVAILSLAFQVPLWIAKRRLAGVHPALGWDADRTRALLERAALLLAGGLLGLWFPWADAITGLALALHLFIQGQGLAKGTALRAAACGGCGSGCG